MLNDFKKFSKQPNTVEVGWPAWMFEILIIRKEETEWLVGVEGGRWKMEMWDPQPQENMHVRTCAIELRNEE